MYINGQGVAQNYKEAVRLFTLAAEGWQPLVPAQNNLGVMYSKGYGVKRDHTEAIKWFLRAAEKGYVHAQYNLGSMYHDGTVPWLPYPWLPCTRSTTLPACTSTAQRLSAPLFAAFNVF